MGAMLHLDPNRCYATTKANFNFGTQKETFLSLVNVKTVSYSYSFEDIWFIRSLLGGWQCAEVEI